MKEQLTLSGAWGRGEGVKEGTGEGFREVTAAFLKDK